MLGSAARTGCRSPILTTARSHFFGGRYLELALHERIHYTNSFDDAGLPGEMQVSLAMKKVSVGTELTIVLEGMPEAIPAEACHLGWEESLAQLVRLVEAEIADQGCTSECRRRRAYPTRPVLRRPRRGGARVLQGGAEVELLMCYQDNPESPQTSKSPPGPGNKVMR